MPSPTLILKKSNEFDEAYKRGKKVFSRRLSLYYQPDDELRIGISISKKQGSAVRRNRAKRLIKEFFRLNSGRILTARVIIVAKAPLLSSQDETGRIMLELLQKAGLTK